MERTLQATASGIAHLSFSGGAVFLPARTPYDRQLLAEYVTERVQIKGRVQILVDGRRWLAERLCHSLFVPCRNCCDAVSSTCYSAPEDQQAYCAKCALGAGPIQRRPDAERQAG